MGYLFPSLRLDGVSRRFDDHQGRPIPVSIGWALELPSVRRVRRYVDAERRIPELHARSMR
jgi:hypothetical protein